MGPDWLPRSDKGTQHVGLALLGIAASAHWYLTRLRSQANAPLRDWLILGVLTGLTLFTRVDWS